MNIFNLTSNKPVNKLILTVTKEIDLIQNHSAVVLCKYNILRTKPIILDMFIRTTKEAEEWLENSKNSDKECSLWWLSGKYNIIEVSTSNIEDINVYWVHIDL